MRSNFNTRLLLVVVAVLFSLVMALTAALLDYVATRHGLAALTAGAGAFVATMTLAMVVLTVLLQ